MEKRQPIPEFGKRRPAAPPGPVPAKRSGHVALLLMGTFAVGGSAYALMPSETCAPASPGTAGAALPPSGAPCTSHAWGGGRFGGYGGSSRLSFFGNDSSARTAAAMSSDSASGGVTRGGFGSLARAFGFSGHS